MRSIFAAAIALATLALVSCASVSYEDAQKQSAAGHNDKAVAELRELVKQGDLRAMVTLGAMEVQGVNVAQDYAAALKLFNQAADHNMPEAEVAISAMYQKGLGVPQDPSMGATMCLRAAERGYPPGESCIGYLYMSGTGVPLNPSSALRWLSAATDDGDMLAAANLGFMYGTGLGVDKDPVEALGLYEVAAERGHFESQLFVGASYEQGNDVAQDQTKADVMFKMAADREFDKVDDFAEASRAIISAHVVYPPMALADHREGDVTVKFDCTEQTPANVRVITSSGDKGLDQAALDAVRKALLPRRKGELHKMTSFVLSLNFSVQHHHLTPPGGSGVADAGGIARTRIELRS